MRARPVLVLAVGLFCVLPGGLCRAQTDALSDRVLRELANVRADLAQAREDRAKLVARLEHNQQLIYTLSQRVQEGERRTAELQRQLATEAAGRRADVAKLQAAVAAEQAARGQALKEMITSVSREISAAVAGTTATGSAAGRGQRMQGEYDVQRGDTLGAIAQAFGVSVANLKKANGLTNDLIVENQKLKIPAQ